ncbi:ORF018 [Staphylococcus phage PT1028]|nr:ORF018 [Staphylococcus phage PT1028]SCU14211.1 Uncharacterised protein [Staphylococcus aureus]
MVKSKLSGYGGSCSVTTRADTPAFSSAIFAIDDSPVEIKIFRHSFLAFSVKLILLLDLLSPLEKLYVALVTNLGCVLRVSSLNIGNEFKNDAIDSILF